MSDHPDLQPLIQEVEALERALDAMHEVTRAVLQPRDLANLSRTIFLIMRTVLPFDAGYLEQYNARTDTLITLYSIDEEIDDFPNTVWNYRSSPPIKWLMEQREPVVFADLQVDAEERFGKYRSTPFGNVDKLSHAWMSVPLLVGSDIVGIVNIQSYNVGIYGPFEQSLLQMLSSPIAVAVANASLIARLENRIASLRIPIIPIGNDVLVIPLVEGLDQMRLEQSVEAILQSVVNTASEYVLFDLSGVRSYDPHLIRMISQLTQALGLSGSQALLIGMHPILIEGLLQMGVDFADVKIARDLPTALRLIHH